MSMEMKKQILEELMGLMDDHLLSKFKKSGADHSIEVSKMKVGEDEMPAEIKMDDAKNPEGEGDDDKIDPEMLKQLMEMQDDKENC